MSAVRRALAVLPAAAVVTAAPSAGAAEIKTFPCVSYISGQQTMPVAAAGFTPGGLVTLYTNSRAATTPRILLSVRVNAVGGFQTATLPPPFTRSGDNLETFNLIAEDKTDPAAPVIAIAPFQVVRFGMTRSPEPKRPGQAVTYTARGFLPGKRVYAHFRHGGRTNSDERGWRRATTRRTVSLGIAKGPCGITSKRMRALPTRVRYGSWRVYVDQSRRFSMRTRPQWIDSFSISRVRS